MRFRLVEIPREGDLCATKGICVVDEIDLDRGDQVSGRNSQVYTLSEKRDVLPFVQNRLLRSGGKPSCPKMIETIKKFHEILPTLSNGECEEDAIHNTQVIGKSHPIKEISEFGYGIYSKGCSLRREILEEKATIIEKLQSDARWAIGHHEGQGCSHQNVHNLGSAFNEIILNACRKIDNKHVCSSEERLEKFMESLKGSHREVNAEIDLYVKSVEKVEFERAAKIVETRKKKLEEEERRRRLEEEERKRRLEEEERKRRLEEEERRRRLEEEERRRRLEEEERRRRLEEEERRRRLEEEERRRRLEEEGRRRKLEEEERRRKSEEERKQKLYEEEKNKQSSLTLKSSTESKQEQPKYSETTENLDDVYIILSPEVAPYVGDSRVAFFKTQLAAYNEIKVKYDQLKDSHNLFEFRMVFKTRVGQLTLSQSKIIEISKVIHKTLEDLKPRGQDIYNCGLYYLTEVIVSQGESEISVRKKNSIPIAFLCALLAVQHEKFLGYLLGCLYNKCPFILPRYRVKDESENVYFKMMKYKIKNGVRESDTQYCERMSGIFAIYSALIQTSQVTNPHGIENGWSWIAITLNQKPTSVTPHVLYTFFEVAGSRFLNVYKRQALKIISIVRNTYIKMFPEDCVSTAHRINTFFSDNLDKTRTLPLLAEVIRD